MSLIPYKLKLWIAKRIGTTSEDLSRLLCENIRLSEDVRKYRHLYEKFSSLYADLNASKFEEKIAEYNPP